MSKPSISPPLPLPIGFRLLPSLLPGQQLTPCLYTEINDLPIFLIISPTLVPQLSFLSLILALKHQELASPLSIGIWYNPTPAILDPTLRGLAPWSDLWIPLPLARVIVRDIGAERLFWDNKGRGLLGNVDDAVSWEEDGGWSHNWVPAKTHLPTSSYSFDNLLTTRWPSIDVIPDQRCVYTAVGAQRLYKLVSDGRFSNPSMVRDGIWDTVFKALLEWSKRSYTEFSTCPIKLSSPAKQLPDQDEPISTFVRSIPALFDLPSTPAPPISSSDMNSLFPSGDISIVALVLELAITLWNAYLAMIPIRFVSRLTISSDRQPASKKLRVKINLALCALAWDLVIGIWHLKRDNTRLRRALEEGGKEMVRDINISELSESKPDESAPKRSRHRKAPKGDDITNLEKRRGASPPPLKAPESGPSQSGSSGRSKSSVKHSKPHSPLPRKRKTGDSRAQMSKSAPIGSTGQASKGGRNTIYNLDQHVQALASSESESESDWFDVSPRKRDQPGEDHEKISRWYSRSPRRSSESSSNSEESDHLPTPHPVPVPLPLLDHYTLTPPPDYQQTPTTSKYVGPVEGDDVYHFSNRSDRWLNDDCDPDHVEEEPTGSMSFPFIVEIVDFVRSPVIVIWLGMGLIMFFVRWWESDPPEPAVVVS